MAGKEEPLALVTIRSCEPSVPAGVTAVIWVGETTTIDVQDAKAMVTSVVPVKFVPVIVIGVPPVTTP